MLFRSDQPGGNASQQVGGSIGVAAATTIAATYSSRYLGSGHSASAAPTHGFQIAFYVLAAVTLVAAVASAVIVESAPRAAADPEAEIGEEPALEAAA